jgi:hypothetical protein
MVQRYFIRPDLHGWTLVLVAGAWLADIFLEKTKEFACRAASDERYLSLRAKLRAKPLISPRRDHSSWQLIPAASLATDVNMFPAL